VLVVTHLPQVAACADHHLVVSKAGTKERVASDVQSLRENQRVEEIARMLGGVEITAKTRAHAREMLAASARSKPLGSGPR
jgi:DNA repair protein RecN (Recombination protein N)